MKDYKNYAMTVFTTAIGGIVLLFATIFLNAFFSSPPTRAEYNEFKATITTQNISIDQRLNRLGNGQEKIINMIVERLSTKEKKNE